MKSLIPAALVLVLEAGFIFSIAALPSAPDQLAARAQAGRAVVQAPAAPAQSGRTPSRRS